MSRKKYSSEQIIRLLRQGEVILGQGESIARMCKELGIYLMSLITSGVMNMEGCKYRRQSA